MEFQDVVDRRRMVRDYADAPVDPAVVDRALRNATRAPNAGFTQGWAFVVLDTPADVRRWWTTTAGADAVAAPDPWLAGMMRAPVVVVPCSSRTAYLARYAEQDKARSARIPTDEEPWSVPYWHMDAAMASLLILQTVVDAGLGACFAGIPVDRLGAVRAELAVPEAFDPVGVITIGHPAGGARSTGSPTRRRRRDQSDVVHRGGWPSGTTPST